MKYYLSAFLACVICCFSCQERPATNAVASTVDSNTVADWKLGVQMWTFHRHTFLQGIQQADSAGIRFIEAYLGQPLGGDYKDTFDLNMSVESKTSIKQLLLSKNMALVAIGVVVPATPAEWKRTFDFARDMGIQYITAEPLREHWDTVNSMAGEYKIMVAIHDHPRPSRYDHPDSVMAAINGRINLGACADLGHWARNGLDVTQCLQTLKGRVIGVHLKDIKTFNDVKAEDVILGTGVIKFPEVFKELHAQGFEGMLSIEHEANIGNNLQDVIKNRDYFLQQVRQLK